MNADNGNSFVASCRFLAPATFPDMTFSNSSAVHSTKGVDCATPAAWTTTDSSGSRATSRAVASGSATSHAARVTSVPSSRSSSASSAAPGESAPRRLTRTRCPTPRPANQRATCDPSAPVPPVTSAVPENDQSPGAGFGAGTKRRPNTPVSRTATWSSVPSARTARTASVCSPASTTPPQTSGCSRATTLARPHTSACSGEVSRSSGPVETAPRVTAQTLVSEPITACTSSRVAAASRNDTTPSGSADRSLQSVTSSASSAAASDAPEPSGETTSQRPSGRPAGTDTGCQVI